LFHLAYRPRLFIPKISKKVKRVLVPKLFHLLLYQRRTCYFQHEMHKLHWKTFFFKQNKLTFLFLSSYTDSHQAPTIIVISLPIQVKWVYDQSTIPRLFSTCDLEIICDFDLNNWLLPTFLSGITIANVCQDWSTFYIVRILMLTLFNNIAYSISDRFQMLCVRNKCIWSKSKYTLYARIKDDFCQSNIKFCKYKK
jgi:hypothetical protein